MKTSTLAMIVVVVVVVSFVAGYYTHSATVAPPTTPSPTPPPTPPPSTWEVVQQRGTLIIGSSPDWPPYEYLDPTTGEFTGFEVELIEIIAERLGLTVEWREMGFDLIIPEVQAKTIDLGVSGFSIYPERLETVQFVMPHSITEGQVIMLKSRAEGLGIVTEFESLEEFGEYDLVCGAQVATTQEDELLALEGAGKLPEGTAKTYEDYLVALADMKRGVIDGIYAETPVSSWWMLEAEEKGEEPMVVVFRRPYYPVAFVANLESDELVSKITGELAEMIAAGELDELKVKWKAD